MSRFFAVCLLVMLGMTACTKGTGVDNALPENGHGGGYSISVGAGENSTRAELGGDMVFRWSPSDRVGFYMVPRGGTTPIASNVKLTSVNKSPERVADFEGELSAASLIQVSPSAAYDYYSYYPYNANAGSVGFPKVTFSIPGTVIMTPDVFPVEYGFMIGSKQTSTADEKPISWLESGQQRFGKHIGFQYRHVFAYLEVYLRLNLMSQPVNKIVVTCTDGSAMSGTAQIDLETGVISFANASSSLIINLAGTIDVASGRIWIPINPALAGKEFKFTFYTTGGNSVERTITGGALQGGMKHKAGFKLPFYISFGSLNSASVSNNRFSYLGYSFGCSSSYFSTASDEVKLAASAWAWDTADKYKGTMRSPILNLTNTDGLSSIPVKLSVNANGGVDPSSSDRSLQSRAVSSTTVEISANNGVTVPYNKYGVVTAPNVLNLTSSTPCIGMRSSTWGAYAIWIKEIWIEPAY